MFFKKVERNNKANTNQMGKKNIKKNGYNVFNTY